MSQEQTEEDDEEALADGVINEMLKCEMIVPTQTSINEDDDDDDLTCCKLQQCHELLMLNSCRAWNDEKN